MGFHVAPIRHGSMVVNPSILPGPPHRGPHTELMYWLVER